VKIIPFLQALIEAGFDPKNFDEAKMKSMLSACDGDHRKAAQKYVLQSLMGGQTEEEEEQIVRSKPRIEITPVKESAPGARKLRVSGGGLLTPSRCNPLETSSAGGNLEDLKRRVTRNLVLTPSKADVSADGGRSSGHGRASGGERGGGRQRDTTYAMDEIHVAHRLSEEMRATSTEEINNARLTCTPTRNETSTLDNRSPGASFITSEDVRRSLSEEQRASVNNFELDKSVVIFRQKNHNSYGAIMFRSTSGQG